MSNNDYTPEDYRETVEAMAKDILEDQGLDSDDWQERIHEDVDSNAYIIMYAGPPVVQQASDNFPTDMGEVTAMAGPDADFNKLLQVAAYMAMEQDVTEACRKLAEDADTCSRCDTVVFPDAEGGPMLYECQECSENVCIDCMSNDEDLCKDCYEDVDIGPTEDDAVYQDSGPLGSKTSIHFGSVFLGEFDTEEEAFASLRTRANLNNFFPNVWNISDHGNLILQKDFDWKLK